MREIQIRHRENGRGYLLIIEGVQETILMGADDFLFIERWCQTHYKDLEQESKNEHDENARRLLD